MNYILIAKKLLYSDIKIYEPITDTYFQGFPTETYPLGTSILITPFYYLFGIKGPYLFSLLTQIALILITGIWIRSSGGNPLFASLIFAYAPIQVLGRLPMSDIPTAFLVSLGCLLFWKGYSNKNLWLIAGFVGTSIFLFREAALLLPLILFIGTILKNNKKYYYLLYGGLLGLILKFIVNYTLSDYGIFDNLFSANNLGLGMGYFAQNIILTIISLLFLFPLGLINPFLYRGPNYRELNTAVLLYIIFYVLYQWNSMRGGILGSIVTGIPRFMIPIIPVLAYQSSIVLPNIWKKYFNNKKRISKIIIYGWITLNIISGFTVHWYMNKYSSSLTEIRNDIKNIVTDDSIIITNTNFSEKMINNIYGFKRIIDYRHIDENQRENKINNLRKKYDNIYLVIIQRSESQYWREINNLDLQFVYSVKNNLTSIVTQKKYAFNKVLSVWRFN